MIYMGCKMHQKIIEKEWTKFAATALLQVPRNSIQYAEMQKAFYAGFVTSLLWAQSDIGTPEVDEDSGVEMLDAALEEGHRFFAALMS